MDEVDTSAEAVKECIDRLPLIDNSVGIDPRCHIAKSVMLALVSEREAIQAEWAADLVRKGKETNELRRNRLSSLVSDYKQKMVSA